MYCNLSCQTLHQSLCLNYEAHTKSEIDQPICS